MNRRVATIFLLTALSAASTLYGIVLVLTIHNTVVNGGNTASGVAEILVRPVSFPLPIAIGIIGWLTTLYEVLTIKQKEISGTLRKRMSKEGFDRNVYRIFSGRGGARRVAIMDALNTPKLRNEIANITNTDWKEVDRNIKILESLNLVRIQFSHGSLSVYHLTESGKELLEIIHSQIKSNGSKASTVHS